MLESNGMAEMYSRNTKTRYVSEAGSHESLDVLLDNFYGVTFGSVD